MTPALIGRGESCRTALGPEVGGWLVGLPFVSGLIAFFLATSEGADFAAAASLSILIAADAGLGNVNVLELFSSAV